MSGRKFIGCSYVHPYLFLRVWSDKMPTGFVTDLKTYWRDGEKVERVIGFPRAPLKQEGVVCCRDCYAKVGTKHESWCAQALTEQTVGDQKGK